MKNNIKISKSINLQNIINQNKFLNILFSPIQSHLITEYNNNINININILSNNSQLYYIITINNNSIYYGLLDSNEINLNINIK